MIVCSPGGVATTALLQYLMELRATNLPDDGDGLKHVPTPDVLLGSSDFTGRILYIDGDPEIVVKSIDRRGWIRIQGAKLGSLATVLLPLSLARRTFRRVVERQITAFTQTADDRVLCVEFEALWDRQAEIARFLDLDEKEFARGFPKRRERHTQPTPTADAGVPEVSRARS